MIYLMIVAMGLVVFLIVTCLSSRACRCASTAARASFWGLRYRACSRRSADRSFLPDHQLNLSPANPYLLAGICAIGLMYWTRSVLITVLLSMALFYLFRWWV